MRRRQGQGQDSKTAPSAVFARGREAGTSLASPIVIRGASSDFAGTGTDFANLTQLYGQKRERWKLIWHSHGRYESRETDIIEIELPDEKRRRIFFDVSEPFGKFPETTEIKAGFAETGDPGEEDTLS